MAFMPAPRLVLLDEPCAGVNPSLVDQLRELLVELNKTQGGSFVVIEHNMDFIMRLCPHVHLHGRGQGDGRRSARGRPGEPPGARRVPRQLMRDFATARERHVTPVTATLRHRAKG